MDRTCLYSFILPIYNKGRELARCVDSILAQAPGQAEILLVDDGSEDDTGAVCEACREKDARVRCFSQPNSGVSAARNLGLQNARGEWICFVDPDDALAPGFLRAFSPFLESGADILCCCCRLDGENGEIVHFYGGSRVFSRGAVLSEDGFEPEDKTALLLELMDAGYQSPGPRRTAVGVPWGKLYRRAFLSEHGLSFDPALVRMQDNIFNMRAFDLAEKVLYLDEPLYLYSVDHVSGYMARFDPRAPVFLDRVLRERAAFLKEKGLLRDPEIRAFRAKEVFRVSDWMLTKHDLNPANPAPLGKRRLLMKERFSGEPYRTAFAAPASSVRGFRRRLRLELLRKGRYRTLLLLGKCRLL